MKELSRLSGMAEAEIIRQALDRHLHPHFSGRRDLAAWKIEKEFIQDLLDAGPVSGGRTWKREELYKSGRIQ